MFPPGLLGCHPTELLSGCGLKAIVAGRSSLLSLITGPVTAIRGWGAGRSISAVTVRVVSVRTSGVRPSTAMLTGMKPPLPGRDGSPGIGDHIDINAAHHTSQHHLLPRRRVPRWQPPQVPLPLRRRLGPARLTPSNFSSTWQTPRIGMPWGNFSPKK